jgi:putative addiction module killer protein
MISVRRTDKFDRWLKDLSDTRARAKILVRIDRLADGNPGDVAAVGRGISEMRINYGPGYRVYYSQRGRSLIILLCAGDKGSQVGDIREAKKLLSELQG